MTPKQYIKQEILILYYAGNEDIGQPAINDSNIDKIYEELHEDDRRDEESEFRYGDHETDIEPDEYSRHYDVKSHASQMTDGTWVGWNHWYGGGKHGSHEDIEWMENAYFVDHTEKEKMVTVHTFVKKEDS